MADGTSPHTVTNFEPERPTQNSRLISKGHEKGTNGLFDRSGTRREALEKGLSPGETYGADDEIRTRDPHLGKVMLYQLSHIRMYWFFTAR
jgi:hypothetical protein